MCRMSEILQAHEAFWYLYIKYEVNNTRWNLYITKEAIDLQNCRRSFDQYHLQSSATMVLWLKVFLDARSWVPLYRACPRRGPTPDMNIIYLLRMFLTLIVNLAQTLHSATRSCTNLLWNYSWIQSFLIFSVLPEEWHFLSFLNTLKR